MKTALIVDLHSFTKMFDEADDAKEMADFLYDVLIGVVMIVERNRGAIVNTTGDGALSLFDDPNDAFYSACQIVADIGDQHEYIARHKGEDFPLCPGETTGLRCRIALEEGIVAQRNLDTANGLFTLWVGEPVNYAARIIDIEEATTTVGERPINTIVVGPTAFEHLRHRWSGFLPAVEHVVKGKRYVGYPFDTVDLFDE